jgi:hypothetical protein
MPSYFRESRDTELSLLFYLSQQFASDWSDINLIKTFHQAYSENYALPIVCVRLADTATTRLEIGANTLDNAYLLVCDIFGRSSAQSLDIADYVKEKLSLGWVYYEHSHQSGDNSVLERTANGKCYVTDFLSDSPVFIEGSDSPKDRYRHSISVRVKNT